MRAECECDEVEVGKEEKREEETLSMIHIVCHKHYGDTFPGYSRSFHELIERHRFPFPLSSIPPTSPAKQPRPPPALSSNGQITSGGLPPKGREKGIILSRLVWECEYQMGGGWGLVRAGTRGLLLSFKVDAMLDCSRDGAILGAWSADL